MFCIISELYYITSDDKYEWLTLMEPNTLLNINNIIHIELCVKHFKIKSIKSPHDWKLFVGKRIKTVNGSYFVELSVYHKIKEKMLVNSNGEKYAYTYGS